MKSLIINIDWVPNNFSAAPEDERLACVATGKTLEDVKKNIIDAVNFHIAGLVEDGESAYGYSVGEWEPVFHISTRAQLKFSGRYITSKALSRETGIAQQQLSHYANGRRHPRPAIQHRINEGIQSICDKLSCIL